MTFSEESAASMFQVLDAIRDMRPIDIDGAAQLFAVIKAMASIEVEKARRSQQCEDNDRLRTVNAELLEALQMMVNAESAVEREAAMFEARAAIAKARG